MVVPCFHSSPKKSSVPASPPHPTGRDLFLPGRLPGLQRSGRPARAVDADAKRPRPGGESGPPRGHFTASGIVSPKKLMALNEELMRPASLKLGGHRPGW
jgi:hypothetical protein